MTSAMVTKLNGIATGANKYALPTASSSTLGGIKVGSGLAISGGVLSVSNPGETKELLFSGKLLSGGTYDFSKSITSFKKVLVTAEYADSGTTRISQKTLYVDQCPINASTVTDIAVTAGTANICFPEAAKFSITVGGSTSYTFKIYGVK